MRHFTIWLTTLTLVTFSSILFANPKLLQQACKAGRWHDVQRMIAENPSIDIDYALPGEWTARQYLQHEAPQILESLSINGIYCDEESPLVPLHPENPVESRAKRFCRKIAEYGPLVCCAVGALGYGVFEVIKELMQGETWSHALAKGVAKPIHYVVVPGVSLSTLSCIRLPSRVFQHKVVSSLLGAFGLIHGASALIHKPHEIASQHGVTGVIMLSAFALASSSYLFEASRCCSLGNYHSRFLAPHLGAGLIFLSYGFHESDWSLAPYAGGALILYAAGNMIELARSTRVLATAWRIGDKVVLEVPYNSTGSIKSGQFFFIKFGYRYHPFSAALVNQGTVSFLIGQAGAQTQELFESLDPEQISSTREISIRGPYGEGLRVKKELLIVTLSTGSGCAPFIALLNELQNDRRKNKHSIQMHHSERVSNSFELIVSEAQIARSNGVLIELHLYFTGEGDPQIQPSNWIYIHKGRMRPDESFPQQAQYFFCGNHGFEDAMCEKAHEFSWDYQRVDF